MPYLPRLDALADSQPSKEAIVDAHASLTYSQLAQRVRAAAAALEAAGLREHHVVGLSIGDETEHIVASLALLAVGTTHFTLATHDSAEARLHIAQRVAMTHLLGAGDEPLAGYSLLRWPLDARAAASAAASDRREPPGRLLLMTSGTTGGMNVVPFSGPQLAQQSARHAEYADERLLRLASIEHNNSKRHRLYCVWNGGTNVFRPHGTFDLVDFVHATRVTCLDISRMHASDLAAMEKASSLGHVKVRTGGSAIPYAVRREVETRVTRRVYVRYATSEFGAISMAGPGDHDAEEASGRPLPGVDLQIVGPDDVVLAPGETGEIRLRGVGMAQGYLGSDEQSARRFRGGWFYPGDTGRLRADGQVVIEGRTDDMIVMNGVNIFPAQIERVLQQHPAVATAAAFPVPSKVHGQIPVAAVELQPGAGAAPIELQAYAREQLALRAPRKVLVLESLPRNAQGKVLRRELVRMMEADKT